MFIKLTDKILLAIKIQKLVLNLNKNRLEKRLGNLLRIIYQSLESNLI